MAQVWAAKERELGASSKFNIFVPVQQRVPSKAVVDPRVEDGGWQAGHKAAIPGDRLPGPGPEGGPGGFLGLREYSAISSSSGIAERPREMKVVEARYTECLFGGR